MSWSVTAEPARFDEAVEWFGSRFPLTEELAEALGPFAGPRAWTIAGVAQLEVVQHVHESLERAIANGTDIAVWKDEVEASLTQAWGRKNSARLDTIFVNATNSAHQAGRWEQIREPDVLALRPYGFFDGVTDSRQTPICRECDGTILPLDDPWWATHAPPLHHRCRSSIRNMRESEVRRRGGPTASPPTSEAAKGFGAIPTTAEWQPDRSKYDPKIWNTYEAKQAELEKSPRPRLKKTG